MIESEVNYRERFQLTYLKTEQQQIQNDAVRESWKFSRARRRIRIEFICVPVILHDERCKLQTTNNAITRVEYAHM